jgi:hypothetical protein
MKSGKTGTLGALLVLAAALMLVAFAGPASAHRNHHRIRHHGGRSLNQALSVNQVQSSDDEGDGGGSSGTGDTSSDAGTIAAFDSTTGLLTVALTDGSSITGLVTDETEISCTTTSDDNSGDDDSGSGDDDSGSGGGDDGGGGGDSVNASHLSDDGGSGDGDGSGSGDDGTGTGTGTGTGDEPQCSTADLTVGAVVQEAELKLENGEAVFDEIQLAV